MRDWVNLPVIFNWCYEGFHILQVVREFVEMEDEVDAKTEFIRASNPLIMFLEDMNYHGQHSRASIYNDYRNWCVQAGHNQASRRSVIAGIRQLMRDTLFSPSKRPSVTQCVVLKILVLSIFL